MDTLALCMHLFIRPIVPTLPPTDPALYWISSEIKRKIKHPQQMEQEQQQAPTEQQTAAATGSGQNQMQPQAGGASAQSQVVAGGQNQREQMVQVPQFQPVYYGVA